MPLLLVAASFGNQSVFANLAVFFSKLAVVTFGGAYAVLAYLAQQAVATYGWVTPSEMLDGPGLAETTPGPLILVNEFVGFLAGYRSTAEPSLAHGLSGAAITLWATFVPCFLWIFVGAPYLERIEQMPKLASALAGVTAAVVGVILNLSVWFGLHVLFAEIAVIRVAWMQVHMPVLGSMQLQLVPLLALAALMSARGVGVGTVVLVSGTVSLACSLVIG